MNSLCHVVLVSALVFITATVDICDALPAAKVTESAPTSSGAPLGACDPKCEQTPYKECKLQGGKARCVCKQGLEQNEQGSCEIMRKVKVTIKIKRSGYKKRSAQYSIEPCDSDVMKQLKEQVSNIDEATIKCTSDEITFEVYVNNDNEGADLIKDLFKNCSRQEECQLGPAISIDTNSTKDHLKQARTAPY